MKNKDSRKQKLQKLKDSSFFHDKTLPKVRRDIDVLLDKLDKELAENKKIIAENDRKILETVSYEELLKIIQLVR